MAARYTTNRYNRQSDDCSFQAATGSLALLP
jgi:hypothetical protein